MIQEKTFFQLQTSKNGLPILKYKDICLHSPYDPVRDAQKSLSSLDFKNKKIIIIYGLALGYHVEYILNLNLKSQIIVIEKNPEIIEYLKKSHRLDIFRNHIHLFVDDLKTLENSLDFLIEEQSADNIIQWDHKPSLSIGEEYYNQAKFCVNKILKIKLQSYITTLGFSKRWHENILKNLKYIRHFYKLNKKLDVPVFIIGSGPGLDDHLRHLPSLKNYGIIIALAPVFHHLIKQGIDPHFVISTDAGIANRIHHLPDNSSISKTILVTSLSVSSYIFKTWKGDILIINQKLPLEDYLLDNTMEIPMKGTVFISSFELAKQISSGPIILLGLDFAYHKGKYHFCENNMEKIFLFKSNKLNNFDNQLHQFLQRFQKVILKGYYNDDILTNSSMESYLNYFQHEVQLTKNKIYSMDSHGAFIKGVTLITFNKLFGILNTLSQPLSPEMIIKKTDSSAIKVFQDKIKSLLNEYQNLKKDIELKSEVTEGDLVENMYYSKPFRDVLQMSLCRIFKNKLPVNEIYSEVSSSLNRSINYILKYLTLNTK